MNGSVPAQWFFEPSVGGRQGDTVAHLQSHTHLEELELLIREAVQNSLDAMVSSGPEKTVTVRIRIKELTGVDKETFLSCADRDGRYLTRLQASRDYRLFLAEKHKGSKPHAVEITQDTIQSFDPRHPQPLRLLYIEDQHTTGLTGEEFDFVEDSRFCAFARDQDFSVKRDKRSGGSHGKGKNTLWRNARCRLLLAYSRLSEAYSGEVDRFIGIGRLPWHANHVTREPDSRRSGNCYLGREGSEGTSVLGAEARLLGERLGMARDGYRTGTSLCIVGFDPLGAFSERQVPELVLDIAHTAETWYWPAIVDGTLEIAVVDDSTGKESEVDPYTGRPDLEPYIAAWVKSEAADMDSVRRCIAKVPRGPGEQDQPADAPYVIACQRCETEIAADKPPRRTAPGDSVALVRGFGMVVQYRSLTPRALAASNYAGVCRAGMAVPSAGNPGERLEVLLSSAEPPAHDVWNPNDIDTQLWPKARAQVLKILATIQSAVDELAGGHQTAQSGESQPELARRFRLKGDIGTPPRASELAFHAARAPERDGGKVHFYVEAKKLDGKAATSGSIFVRLRGEVQDPAAGPLAGSAGEAIEIIGLRIGTSDFAPARIRKSDKWEARVDLAENGLPNTMRVTMAVSEAMDFPEASFGLKLWGRLEGTEDAEVG